MQKWKNCQHQRAEAQKSSVENGWTGDHHVKQKKPDSGRQIAHFLSYVGFTGREQGHESKRRTTRDMKGEEGEGEGNERE
jgi:hypothetical protein